MSDKLFLIMKDFAFEAGKLAMKYYANSYPSLKPDDSVLTKADKAISQLARKTLKPLLKTGKHLLSR